MTYIPQFSVHDPRILQMIGVKRYLQDVQNLNITEDYLNRTVTDRFQRKVRILCLVLTIDADFDSKAKTVEGTWAKRCNSYYFVANTKRTGPHIIHSTVDEKRNNLMKKVTNAFKHIYANLMSEFDWIFKCDDDTYAILENMRFLLSHYNSSKPGYLGYHFNRHVHNGYMSGGAGYVLSKAAFKTLVEEGLYKDICNFSPTNLDPEASEDINIGQCLNKTGVPVLSSLDVFRRETFHPYPIQQYLTGSLPGYLYEWAMTKPETGPMCCSRFTVTFHYMSPESMILVDHLLYRISVYGLSLSQNPKKVFKIGPVQHKSHS